MIANSSDYPTVSIFFADPSITCLFSELLQIRGVHTQIITHPEDLGSNSKVITEPQFFSLLDAGQQKSCLLVSNNGCESETDALTLFRPLTEDKIEAAFNSFLKT